MRRQRETSRPSRDLGPEATAANNRQEGPGAAAEFQETPVDFDQTNYLRLERGTHGRVYDRVSERRECLSVLV